MADASNAACVVVAEPADDQLRQAGELVDVAGLAHGEHQRDPLGQQAPRHERQRLRGGPIEPLRVVDQADERLLLGHLGQQAQDRQADEEAVRGVAVLQPERRRAARRAAGRAVASSPSSIGAHS